MLDTRQTANAGMNRSLQPNDCDNKIAALNFGKLLLSNEGLRKNT